MSCSVSDRIRPRLKRSFALPELLLIGFRPGSPPMDIGSYPGAIQAELGEAVTHHTNRYLNSHLGQDHRGMKQRTHLMCAVKSFVSAARFCRVYEEVRQFFRVRPTKRSGVIGV